LGRKIETGPHLPSGNKRKHEKKASYDNIYSALIIQGAGDVISYKTREGFL